MTTDIKTEEPSGPKTEENSSHQKRPYLAPHLTEETVFERAVLANCKYPGQDGCDNMLS